jgi:small-conductance mechanosensitive channel
VLGGTYLFNRRVIFLLGALAERQSSYRLLIKRIVPFLNVFVWSFAIFIVIAGIISPPMETVVAVGASIGIAVGFASQDILKNIFGGFIIIMDRPFQVGDKIEVNSHYGEVMEIGLRSTRIVTPDDSVVSIPNADIVSNSVSNTNSGALDCQVVIEVFLPAKTDIDQVKEIAFKAAISSRYVYLKKPIVVMTANQVHEQNYVMVCKVKAYVLDIRYEFLLKSDITELIMNELNARNLIPEFQSK